MTKLTQVAALTLVCGVAGLIGGVFGASIIAQRESLQKQPTVIRAKQFEAIGEDGRVRARFGLHSGDVPVMEFFGPDNKMRLSIMLDNVDEPVILLRDAKENIRGVLGHLTSDTASLADDDWALSFQVTGEEDTVAQVGMVKKSAALGYKGTVGVRAQGGRWTLVASK